MFSPRIRFFALGSALMTTTVLMTAQERSRAEVDERYTWNLAEIYPDKAAWRAQKDRIAAEIPAVGRFRGALGSSPAALADALELTSHLQKEMVRLYVYASMLADEDTRVAEHQGMQQEMQQMASHLSAAASFLEPELLRLGTATVERSLAAEPRLRPYAFYLRDVVRRAAHTLSDAEEKILADAGTMARSASNIFGILSNADFPYPAITLSDGRTAKVNQAGYAELRALPNRDDRRNAMSAFFSSLGGFSRTFGTMINASLQRATFYATSRHYQSTLEAALDAPNIPVSVYMRLIEGVNANLPTFHRYLRLRQRMMGLDDLHYYDLYAPLVADVNLRYTPEEAQAHVLASVQPLGDDYVSVVRRAFGGRWIDLYPTAGKRSGAYSNGGAYDVHPYILMNYLGQYTDMSTLTHELGHTMHSYYSNRTQPFPTADYQTFVAEVASTFNEALLLDHMLERITDDTTRLSLLGNYLENAKSTVFRQTQFAEFELRMHETAQRGEAITGEVLSRLYADITRRYYGHDQGVCVVDDYVAHEWSYVPHFYSDFYVFQYATSFTAAEALSTRVLAGDRTATTRYLTFLSSGGSKYPIELLKDAGVDMTTDEPLTLTIRKMNAVMDEMEKILGRR